MLVPLKIWRKYFKRHKYVSWCKWHFVFWFLLAICCSTAFGSENRLSSKESLQGIKELFVSVNVGLSRSGPTQTKLQNLVEQKISSLGLVMHPNEEYEEESTIPFLDIDVAVVYGSNNFHTFFVTMKVYQIVTIEQGGKIRNPSAVTWEVATMGVGGIESIQEKVEDLSEVFLRDYRSVN